MSNSNKARLSPFEHILAILGALLVGVGWFAVFGDGAVIHPQLANKALAWMIMVAGLVLSAGLSMHLVLRLRKDKPAEDDRPRP